MLSGATVAAVTRQPRSGSRKDGRRDLLSFLQTFKPKSQPVCRKIHKILTSGN